MRKQIVAILIASALPMVAISAPSQAARPSKLRVTSETSVEERFRSPGEPYTSKAGRKKTKRTLIAHAESPRKKTRDIVADDAKHEIRSSPAAVSSYDFESPEGGGYSQLRASTRAIYRRAHTKNGLSLELLGRGATYSINYDRLLGRSVALGLGFSYMNLQSRAGDFGNMEITIMMVPLYANFYMNDSMTHRLLGTAGVTVANASVVAGSDLANKANKASETPLPFELDTTASASITVPLPIAGIGYEYRSQGGFLARLSGYGVFYGTFQPWAGVGLGSHF